MRIDEEDVKGVARRKDSKNIDRTTRIRQRMKERRTFTTADQPCVHPSLNGEEDPQPERYVPLLRVEGVYSSCCRFFVRRLSRISEIELSREEGLGTHRSNIIRPTISIAMATVHPSYRINRAHLH